MTMKVLQVCTGTARATQIAGKRVMTAIHKTAIEGPVAVGPLGLAGDEQADLSVHGGLSKAVYAYPSEHLAFWQTVRAQARVSLWEEAVPAGLMGENLLLQGVLEKDLWVGDRLLLPQCTLVVSEPRMPCFKFAATMGFAQAVKLMAQSGFCGSYLVVLQGGFVQAGDTFELHPGPREVSISELFRVRARGMRD
jgi:MOSC domain-containing protein YiiM